MHFINKRFLRIGLLSCRLPIIFMCLVGIPSVLIGETIKDTAAGFTLRLPDGFQKFQKTQQWAATNPNITHAFVYGELNDDKPNIIFLIEQLHGVMGRERPKLKEMPPDFQGSIFPVKWQGFELDAFEVPETIQGIKFVAYNVQIPLKRNVIQLKLAGTVEHKAELKLLLSEILDGLHGETNWLRSITGDPVKKSNYYNTILLIIGFGALVIGLVVLWIISKHTPKGTVFIIAVVIYIASWHLGETRISEIRLFSGILRMFGFIGGIMGIVDIVRKRKPKKKEEPVEQ
ncbi:MAG: hypothetical protein K8S55_10355 [Phycisphaerae bacterium]|nr:hypothetical protein [Phycisphaerae bacterium]